MKLPNADQATIAADKMLEYLLSSVRPENQGKSAFFASLGYTNDNWEELDHALLGSI